ncbi:MAG: glycosyltransferase family 2 protein [Lachnospiraceae bacterium]|nr:glycosyltransferase family 2 protein [Lachnospiraceae bacterium]
MEQHRQTGQQKIAVLLTCYNRKEKTKTCISSLAAAKERMQQESPERNYELEFIVTDDRSTDGTPEALQSLPYQIRLLQGTGQLFWCGGMNRSMDYVLSQPGSYQYVMLVNDDVCFYPEALQRLLRRLECSGADIVVGSTVDGTGKMSYGGIKMTSKHFARYQMIEPSEEPVVCDTFNCNCIMMRTDTFCVLGSLDPAYIHSMGDFDYGMRAAKKGFKVINCDAHIGECDGNNIEGTWMDVSLPRRKRLALKEGPKGLPKHDWYHFIRKNYGLLPAWYHSITPYIRILLSK